MRILLYCHALMLTRGRVGFSVSIYLFACGSLQCGFFESAVYIEVLKLFATYDPADERPLRSSQDIFSSLVVACTVLGIAIGRVSKSPFIQKDVHAHRMARLPSERKLHDLVQLPTQPEEGYLRNERPCKLISQLSNACRDVTYSPELGVRAVLRRYAALEAINENLIIRYICHPAHSWCGAYQRTQPFPECRIRTVIARCHRVCKRLLRVHKL